MIRLRIHHVMCMHTYSGTGYSKSFCDGMAAIRNELRCHPDTMLLLVNDVCDDICNACPNRIGSHCKEEASIAKRDQRVADYFELQSGTLLSYQSLIQKIGFKFSRLSNVSAVCGSCTFRTLCDAVLPKNLP